MMRVAWKGLMLGGALALTGGAWAADVVVVGLMEGRATLVVDGARPRTVAVGSTLPGGIKLVAANSSHATVEINGKRKTLELGQQGYLSSNSGDSKEAGSGQEVLQADGQGHFWANVTVNGATIRMLVDTGASMVSIHDQDALRAGISTVTAPKVMFNTANGQRQSSVVKFTEVRLGTIRLHNVDGAVSSGMQQGMGLLGMSFLNRLEMRREGDKLILKKRF